MVWNPLVILLPQSSKHQDYICDSPHLQLSALAALTPMLDFQNECLYLESKNTPPLRRQPLSLGCLTTGTFYLVGVGFIVL